jgi:hypothetical protein
MTSASGFTSRRASAGPTPCTARRGSGTALAGSPVVRTTTDVVEHGVSPVTW